MGVLVLNKVCSFYGHKAIVVTEDLKSIISGNIENLIVNYGVTTFLFSGKSDFDCLCLLIVNQLKDKYPYIKMKNYIWKRKRNNLDAKRKEQKPNLAKCGKIEKYLFELEEEFWYEIKHIPTLARHMERMQAMIDDSDYCVFYYNENYYFKKSGCLTIGFAFYQPEIITKLAYNYAIQKRKKIINLYNAGVPFLYIK